MDAQELRNLQEAYMEVVMSEEWRNDIVEKSGEQPLPYGRMMKKSNELASSKDPKKQKRAAGIYLAANAPKGPKVKVMTKTQKEQTDIYDIILSHLLDEGYVETLEAAEVIMVNMSEEWRQTILEAEVLAMKGGVPGSVKVRPALSIPGTNIGVGPNKPVPGTFTTTTPGQREKIKQGDTHIDRGVGGMQSRVGAGPTSNERRRYNAQLAKSRTPGKPMPQ